MPFYPNEVIQQLKSEADITAVIEQFLPLKRSGNGRFVGVCPFHDDHSPSMYVNPTLGIYKCFACGAGGDVFKFVQEHEKIDFNAAVRWVADFCSFELPSVSNPERAEITEERELVRKLNELACEWFEEQLTLNQKARQYLEQRHITEATRKQFHIGYAPDGREGLRSRRSRRVRRLCRQKGILPQGMRQSRPCRRKRERRYFRQVPRPPDDRHPEPLGSNCGFWWP